MTYNEVIYSTREAIKQYVDDSRIDDREIIFHTNIQRALFYRNQYNQRNRIVDEDIKQLLSVEMKQGTKDLCGGEENCFVLKSVKQLPQTIELHHKNGILKATSTEITDIPFSLVSWNRFPFVGVGKYSMNEIYISVGPDGHLYAKSKNKLLSLVSTIILTAILENPLDVKGFTPCGENEEECFDLDTFIYPIKSYAFAYIQQQIINLFINKMQVPEDEKNDSTGKP